MLESAISLSVPRNIAGAWVADWRGRRSPHLAGLLIAYIQHFARAIGDRIIRPRRDLMFPAVEGPGKAAAVGRHLKSEVRVGDDVDPRRGCGLSRAEESHVLAPLRAEAAQAIEEFEIVRRRGDRRCLHPQHALHGQRSRYG